MRARLSKLGVGVAMVATLAFGGAALAAAGGKTHATQPQVQRTAQQTLRVHAGGENPGAPEQQGETGSATESDGDASAQAAACQKAGIDPNADNVQYDDQTGVCRLDTGANGNQ